MMVGDPDQMIYGFNGSASRFLCENFLSDFNPKTFRLTENYRSSKAVVRAANGIRPGAQTESKFALEGIAQSTAFASEVEEADWIVQSIQSLLAVETHDEIEGNISLENIVVIARNRFVFSKLETALAEHKIAFNIKVGEREKFPVSFFGQVLDASIRLKLNPNDWVTGKKLCKLLSITPPAKWGGNDILSRLNNDYACLGDYQNTLIGKLLEKVDELSSEHPNVLKFEQVFETEIRKLAVEENDEDKRLEYDRSLVELKEFSDRWTIFRKLGLGNTLSAFRNATALGKLNSEVNHGGLTLSTVHTMKGLEKDIVFLMGFSEGTFPDYRAKSASEVDEERNTAFVAVTRARRWLYITYPRSRMMPWGSARHQNPSRFIDEMGLST